MKLFNLNKFISVELKEPNLFTKHYRVIVLYENGVKSISTYDTLSDAEEQFNKFDKFFKGRFNIVNQP